MIDTGSFFAISPSPRTDRHKLGGTFTVDGHPAEGSVYVFKRAGWQMVASTKSNPITGEWKLQGMEQYPERSLIVVATEPTGEYNAEIADFVSQF